MTKSRIFILIVIALSLTIFVLNPIIGNAQAQPGNSYKLTLAEAVEFAKSQNKWVQAANIEENAAGEDRKDAFAAALPTINVNTSYQRFSDLTLFSQGLSHATSVSWPPTANAAAAGVDALFNIYSGGRQRALQREQTLRLNLAKLNTRDHSGNIGLQTAT